MKTLHVGTVDHPVRKMLSVGGAKIWCATGPNVRIVDAETLEIEVSVVSYFQTIMSESYRSPIRK